MSSLRQIAPPVLLAGRGASAKPKARKPSVFARWRLWLVLITLLVLLPIGYVLYGMGDKPRYKYTVHETKLIVDGEAVTVTGVLECARSLLGFSSSPSSYYMVGGTTAAALLRRGGAVLTIFPDACGIDTYMYEPGYYPSIYLVDNTTNPQRIEYHFSDIRLRDPDSRVHLVSFETRRSSFPIRDYRLLERYRWRDSLESTIPGLVHDPALYLGYLMTVRPVAALPSDERAALGSMPADGGEPADKGGSYPLTMQAAPGQVSMNFVWGSVGHLCQLQTFRGDAALCDKLRRTYGIPIVEGKPTLGTLANLLPYAELRRRSDVHFPRSVQPPGRVLPTSVDRVTSFFLFGETYEVRGGAYDRVIFLTPDRETLFTLGVNALPIWHIPQP